MSAQDGDDEDINDEKSQQRDLLAQLQDLHRQLEILRSESTLDSAGNRVLEDRHKLIVCAVCKPVVMSKSSEDDTWIYTESRGGFKSAISSLMESNRVRWVSWPGTHVEKDSQDGVRNKLENEFNCAPVFLPRDIQVNYNRFCSGVLWPLFHSIPFYFDYGFLEGFVEQHEAYIHANQQFVEEVADVYEEGDLVLVHDYHLLLLPQLIRKRIPDVKCGFFLHTPFPSIEFYSMLPVRQPLLQGILGADLVSFNHFDYLRNFLNACTRVLGLESYPSRVDFNGRLISVTICPMGINPDMFKRTEGAEQRHIKKLSNQFGSCKIIVCVDRLDLCKGLPHKLLIMEALLEKYSEWCGRAIMFLLVKDGRVIDKSLARTVDRLVGRINGRFGSVSYFPIHYCKRVLTSDEIISLYSIADVVLVTSLSEGINLTAMEFVACQQECRRGVLMYSEFAGCADSFKGAILINPYDTHQVADDLNSALTMGDTTKQVRHHQLSHYVSTFTSARWAKSMIHSLDQAVEKAREYNNLIRLDVGQLRLFHERSRRRLFLLDYDGTLVNHKSLPQLSSPPSDLLETLSQLANDPNNTVYIVSGRTRADLDLWFSDIANLGLSAEQGYYLRSPAKWRAEQEQILRRREVESKLLSSNLSMNVGELRLSPSNDSQQDSLWSVDLTQRLSPGPSPPMYRADEKHLEKGQNPPMFPLIASDMDASVPTHDLGFGLSLGLPSSQSLKTNSDVAESPWELMAPNLDLSWKDEVILTLEDITERTPGSFLEYKDCSLTWHFRDCDPDFGMTQAKNLQLHFDQMLEHVPVRIVTALQKKYLVITPSRINKGRAVQQILNEHESAGDKFDLILAFGDERTDEDMFDVLQGNHCFTCTVGRKISRATYYVDSPEDVVLALQALAQTSEKYEREAPLSPLGSEHTHIHSQPSSTYTHIHTSVTKPKRAVRSYSFNPNPNPNPSSAGHLHTPIHTQDPAQIVRRSNSSSLKR